MKDLLIANIASHLKSGRAAKAKAAATLVYKLGFHNMQVLTDDRIYMELSISYLAKCCSASLRTAHSAWHEVQSITGFTSIPKPELPPEVRLRPRLAGETWGQHIFTTPYVVEVSQQVSDICGHLVPQKAKTAASDWTMLQVMTDRSARCPFHDDGKASMILNMNADNRTGYAVCMACIVDNGYLTCSVERSQDGRYRCRPTTRRRPVRNVDKKHHSGKTITVDSGSHLQREEKSNQFPTDIWIDCDDPHLLGKLHPNWISRTVAAGGFVDILRRAEKRAERLKPDLASQNATGANVEPVTHMPDMLLSICRMKPSKWRETTNGYMPSGWKATGQDVVLVDLDKAEGVDSMDTAVFVEGIRELVQNEPAMDGRVCIVRTSTTGLQIWLGLTGMAHPKRMSKDGAAWQVRVYHEVHEYAVFAGLTSAKIDKSATGCGRYGRRPAYRIKNSALQRSVLLYSTDDVSNARRDTWHLVTTEKQQHRF